MLEAEKRDLLKNDTFKREMIALVLRQISERLKSKVYYESEGRGLDSCFCGYSGLLLLPQMRV